MQEIIEAKDDEMNREGNKDAIPTKDGVIPCVPWDLAFEPTRLPAIPPLPDLLHTGREKSTEVTQLIQIAAFDCHIVGLTNHGHVLKYGSLQDEAGVIHGRWDYVCFIVWYLITTIDLILQLPLFSEVKRIAEHPVFSGNPPQTLQMTHVSHVFSAYNCVQQVLER